MGNIIDLTENSLKGHQNELNITESLPGSSTDNASSAFPRGSEDIMKEGIAFYLKGFELFPTQHLKVIIGVINVSGIITNAILLSYLVYFRHYRKPVFCALLCLGIADCGVCLAGLALFVISLPFLSGPPWFCNVAVFLTHVSFTQSNYLISLFAILRFFQLVYPLASRARITSGLMARVSMAIFTFAIVHGTSLAYFWVAVKMRVQDDKEVHVCWFIGNANFSDIWNSVAQLMLPCIVTAAFHVSKYLIILLRKSNVTIASRDQEQKIHRQTDSRIIVIIISVYLVTNLPFVIHLLRRTMFKVTFNHLDWFIWYVFTIFLDFNSAINPWIYLIAAESVRSDIHNLLSCNKGEK